MVTWGTQQRIIFHFCIFCYGCFSGGKIIKPFVQNKTFKAFCVIGLALKSLAGIEIKCYKQTHPHGGYWVVLMIKKWLGPTFLLKGRSFFFKSNNLLWQQRQRRKLLFLFDYSSCFMFPASTPPFKASCPPITVRQDDRSEPKTRT